MSSWSRYQRSKRWGCGLELIVSFTVFNWDNSITNDTLYYNFVLFLFLWTFNLWHHIFQHFLSFQNPFFFLLKWWNLLFVFLLFASKWYWIFENEEGTTQKMKNRGKWNYSFSNFKIEKVYFFYFPPLFLSLFFLCSSYKNDQNMVFHFHISSFMHSWLKKIQKIAEKKIKNINENWHYHKLWYLHSVLRLMKNQLIESNPEDTLVT